jgi:hypothetical protein
VVGSDLIAGVEQEERDNDSAEQVHDRRSDDGGANPAHIVAEEAAGSVAEFRGFEILHAEGLYDAVAGRGFLKDLAEVGEASLAVFRRAPDFAAKFADGNDDEREEHGGGERHFPIQPEEHAYKNSEAEAFLKKVGEIFGKRDACTLDIVDGGGEEAADGIVLKKGNRLADDFCVDLVPKIGDRGLPDILDFGEAEIFGDGFADI